MPSKSPTVMTISIPVTRAMMKRVVEASLYEIGDYDDDDFRAAGLSRSKLTADLIADPNFQAQVTRQMTKAVKHSINDAIDYGNIVARNHPLITTSLKALQRAYDQHEKIRAERARNERIKDATSLLREAGFQVVQG